LVRFRARNSSAVPTAARSSLSLTHRQPGCAFASPAVSSRSQARPHLPRLPGRPRKAARRGRKYDLASSFLEEGLRSARKERPVRSRPRPAPDYGRVGASRPRLRTRPCAGVAPWAGTSESSGGIGGGQGRNPRRRFEVMNRDGACGARPRPPARSCACGSGGTTAPAVRASEGRTARRH
jgi:hypothetical protein